jgi:cyclopropane fatty-acyl-phospholipid synthase-like methyltransferase
MRHRITQRTDYILKACAGRTVLHLGCADMPYTRMRLADGTLLYSMIDGVAARQYGLDLSAEGIAILAEAGHQDLAISDVQQLVEQKPFGETRFDVIIAGEIIEHLSNPGLFLESLKPLLSDSPTRLILTTINAYCAYRFFYSLVMRDESVHPDHVSYYSRKTLTGLLSRHGYVVEDFSFYPIGREHKQYINRGRTRLLYWVDRLAALAAPMLGDGLIVTCSVRTQK